MRRTQSILATFRQMVSTRHWGVDAAGQRAMLVADFGLLPLAPADEDDDTAASPNPC
jgi:hypothetical protein